MVVSWLQNSISTSIRSSITFFDNAQDIWLDLHGQLSHQNGPRIYHMKKTLVNLSQENDIVSFYYGNFLFISTTI
jgi:hypothetical protein